MRRSQRKAAEQREVSTLLSSARSASQRVHGDPQLIWLTYPALNPYKMKQPMTKERTNHLARLATPRKPATDVYQDPEEQFRPKLTGLWERDWWAEVCGHSWLDDKEALRRLKKARGGQEIKLAQVYTCAHNDEAIESGMFCQSCLRRLCLKCFEEACPEAMEEFRFRSMPSRVGEFESLGLSRWQAQAVVKTLTPVGERLYNQRRELRTPTPIPTRGSLTKAARAPDSGSPQVLSSRLEKLATPRDRRPFPEISYLPKLKPSLPRLTAVAEKASARYDLDDALSDPRLLEYALDNLQADDEITDWQARALKWCATPVFERLAGDPGRRPSTRG